MSTVIRDLHLVSDKDLELLVGKAREVLTAWAQEWLPGAASWAPTLEASCTNAGGLNEPPRAGWHGYAKSPIQPVTMWAAHSDTALTILAALLVGRQSTAPMDDADWALQVAAKALDELHARLLGEPLPASEAQPDLQLLSGVALVQEKTLGLSWIWQAGTLERHSAVALADGSGDSNSHVQPILSSLASQSVRLSVGLGEVEIPVADLAGLQTGDVIRFPALLKGAVPVVLGSKGAEKPVMQAQLCQLNGHVAVKLVSKQTVA